MENGRFSPIREKRAFLQSLRQSGRQNWWAAIIFQRLTGSAKTGVYAKDWNLSLRVPFTELEEQKKYRAIAIYPGRYHSLFRRCHTGRKTSQEQNFSKILQHRRRTAQLVGKLSDRWNRCGTYDAFIERKNAVGTGKKLQKSLWMAEKSICCSKDDAICFTESVRMTA